MLRLGSLGQIRPSKPSEDSNTHAKHDPQHGRRENAPARVNSGRSFSESQVSYPQQAYTSGTATEPDSSQETTDEDDTFVFEGHDVAELPISVSETIYKRPSLRKLSLKGNQLKTVPAILGGLSSLYYLNLSDNQFTEVPACVSEMRSLEILDMSGNALSSLPEFLGSLPNLIGLSLVNNKIETLPSVIADLPKLVILELDDNPLRLPEHLQPSEDVDEEAWISSLRAYIASRPSEAGTLATIQNREREVPHNGKLDAESQRAAVRAAPERARSASESGIGLRSSKRMGFVMSRNATDQSYVASLHARGASHDAHMLDAGPAIIPPLTAHSANASSVSIANPTEHMHGRSLSSIPTTSEPLDLSTPRSPIPRSPYGSPWGSPRPSLAEAEPQSSMSSRLSTLAEERDADGDTADTDLDSPLAESITRRPSNGLVNTSINLSEHSDELRHANVANSLFKDSYQENMATNSTLVSRHGSVSQQQSKDISDTEISRKSSVCTMRSPSYPNAAFEKLREALSEFSEFLTRHYAVLPTHLRGSLSEASELLSQDNWYLTLKTFSGLLEKITVPTIFHQIITRLDKRQQRRFAMTVMYTFPDLEAAWRLIQQSKLSPLSAEHSSASWAQDEQLHIQLDFAIKQTQNVLSLLNNLVSKSAFAAADASAPATNMANRVRDLSSVCIRCSSAAREVKKLLDRQSSGQTRNLQLSDRRLFWEDVNSFLKAVVNILAAVKTSLPDLPLLADKRVGLEVASLTRVAKEIPPLLEQSSYRMILESNGQSLSDTSDLANSGISLVDLTGPGMLPPPTPLTATLGPAAQALVSPSDRIERPSEGYIQYGIRAHAGEP